jgi:hypothetical protein
MGSLWASLIYACQLSIHPHDAHYRCEERFVCHCTTGSLESGRSAEGGGGGGGVMLRMCSTEEL